MCQAAIRGTATGHMSITVPLFSRREQGGGFGQAERLAKEKDGPWHWGITIAASQAARMRVWVSKQDHKEPTAFLPAVLVPSPRAALLDVGEKVHPAGGSRPPQDVAIPGLTPQLQPSPGTSDFASAVSLPQRPVTARTRPSTAPAPRECQGCAHLCHPLLPSRVCISRELAGKQTPHTKAPTLHFYQMF